MQRLLTLADYDESLPDDAPAYERAVLEVLRRLVEQGWSTARSSPCTGRSPTRPRWPRRNWNTRTARTSASTSTSRRRTRTRSRGFGARSMTVNDADLMIWTTTPWTLPANLAVAVHERYEYALAERDGNATVIAADLHKHGRFGGSPAGRTAHERRRSSSDGTAPGRHDLHPSRSPARSARSSPPTTSRSRTAPAWCTPRPATAEDYQTGLARAWSIYCPVRDDGTYDETVPEWLRGMSVWDANDMVVERCARAGTSSTTHVHPQLPARLAQQDARDLPRDRAVVRRVDQPPSAGTGLAARAGAGRDGVKRVGSSPSGAQPDARHARQPARLVHQPPARLGPAHPRFRTPEGDAVHDASECARRREPFARRARTAGSPRRRRNCSPGTTRRRPGGARGARHRRAAQGPRHLRRLVRVRLVVERGDA
jgi:hypothetical protein